MLTFSRRTVPVSSSAVLDEMRNHPLLAELQETVKNNPEILPMLLSSLSTSPDIGKIIEADRDGFIALLKGEN